MKKILHFIAFILLTAHTCYAIPLIPPTMGTTNFDGLTAPTAYATGLTSPVTVFNLGATGWDFTGTTDVAGTISIAALGAGFTGNSIRVIRTGTGAFIQSVALKSNNSSAFQLNYAYLKVNVPATMSVDMTITGYRNGIAVSGATLTVTNITSNAAWNKFDVSGISAFNNVTEFRFTQAASTSIQLTFYTIDEINIGPAVPLPLTLTNFTGQRQDNSVELNWTTLSEQNTSYFEIQRSTDAAAYLPVGHTPAAGNSTLPLHYTFTDNLPASPAAKYYYRMKMADLDGRFTYSPVIGINVSGSSFGLSAYPNPLGSTTTLTATSPNTGNALLTVTDMSGRQVLSRSVYLQKGGNTLPLSFSQSFGKGIYLLHLVMQGKKETIRLAVK